VAATGSSSISALLVILADFFLVRGMFRLVLVAALPFGLSYESSKLNIWILGRIFEIGLWVY